MSLMNIDTQRTISPCLYSKSNFSKGGPSLPDMLAPGPFTGPFTVASTARLTPSLQVRRPLSAFGSACICWLLMLPR